MITKQNLIDAVRKGWDDLQTEGVVLTGDDYIRAAITELLPLVKAELLSAVRAERLEEPQPGTSDEAYQQAIMDAEAAIEAWEPQP